MRLISRRMYEDVYRPKGWFRIDPYEEKRFLNSFYYFGLGALDESEGVVPLDGPLRIRSGAVEAVYSDERFDMSGRVFGIIGNISTVLHRGLELLASPTIDPGFGGNLQVQLRNHGPDTVSLSPGALLGKCIFFDVSDSDLDTSEFVSSELKESELARRDQARGIIERAAADDEAGRQRPTAT